MATAGERTILGLDIGGTKTAVVEGTHDARILQRRELPTLAHRPFAETLARLLATLREVRATASEAGREPGALSVAIGGPLRIRTGVLIDPPHLPGWHGAHLKDELAAHHEDLPVHVEHDGNAGALAELNFGAGRGRGLEHLVFLTLGTGLGAGLIVNGAIVHGASDTAGEVGHLRLAPSGPVGFGKAGSWEGFASGAGLVRLAHQMYPGRWPLDCPTHALVEAMLRGDHDARHVADEAGAWLGRGMALLIDTLNPQMITVLGLLAVVLGDLMLARAREVVAAEALPQAAAACEILPAKLGRQLGDVAALMAAIMAARRPLPPACSAV
ncbi:MAG: ROK family protein [Planctomycetota bacterium]